jgi:GDP-L-fucose synthase
VDDLANALVFLATLDDQRYNALVDPSQCPLINVGTGTDLTIRELAEAVGRVVGYSGRFVHDTTKPDGTMRKVMDVSRIQSLGWKANTSLQEGIDLTYKKFCEANA